jgi:hypothetical protein
MKSADSAHVSLGDCPVGVVEHLAGIGAEDRLPAFPGDADDDERDDRESEEFLAAEAAEEAGEAERDRGQAEMGHRVKLTDSLRGRFVVYRAVLPPACEPFRFAAGGAALHVDDLAVANGEQLEALVTTALGSLPLG